MERIRTGEGMSEYVTREEMEERLMAFLGGKVEERFMFFLEEKVEDTKRISRLEEEVRELRSMTAGDRTETRNRANQIYTNLKTCGKLTRTEVSKLIDDAHPQAAIRAMQECEARYQDVSIVRDKRGRLHIFLKPEALNVLC